MEGKATLILKDIMQKLSMINSEEVKEEVDNVEVSAEEVAPEVEVTEEVALSEDEVAEEATELSNESAEEDLSGHDKEEDPDEEEELEEEKYVSKSEFDSKIAELKDMIESMKGEMGKGMETYEKEKAELNAQIEKLSAEPAVEPLAHNPEQKQEKNEGFKFGQNRPQSTLDRVMSKLN
tara:strand:- start:583 stop:1119 length:537 start_codon:yes stop_codon:yes gene_type:complete